ncbi:hypothetical protein Tco_1503478 [Tanacetum coccineum]
MFDFATVKTTSTLIETNKALVKDEEADTVDVYLYRLMIGSLMYLTASRPDITFVVCTFARFQVTPKVSHLHVVKRIFRYLKGQPKLGLWYPRDSPFDLEAFSKSDYAGANLDRKSTTGGCQFRGKRLILWQCKKQTIVANSTTEAKYVAAANCYGQNPVFHSKTKHIEIRHHFIKDSYENKLIQVTKIYTDHNVVDLLTKAFDVSRLNLMLPVQVNAVEEKPEESNVFEEIIDFLNASSVQNALTVNPTIYTTCIEQFWTSAKVKIVNRERHIQALVDKKKVIISETSIRSDLKFDDADGTDCLPTATIFLELERMGLHPGMNLVALWPLQSYALPQTKKFNLSKYIFDNMVKNLNGGIKFLMCPRFVQVFLDKQLEGMSKNKGVYVTPSHTKKVFANVKRPCKGFSRRVTPLFSIMMVQATKDMGADSATPTDSYSTEVKEYKEESQAVGKKKEVKTFRAKKVKKEVTLVNETQEMNDDNLMFDTDVLEEQEIEFEKVVEEPVVSVATTTKSIPVSVADVVTTVSANVEVLDELTLAQTLIKIKTAKPKPVTTAATTVTFVRLRTKGIIFHDQEEQVPPEVPLKKKDQVTLDEEMARNLEAQLQAELIKEERLARKEEEEGNIDLIES